MQVCEKTILGYDAKDYSELFTKLTSLTVKQLKAHYGLYEGYVNKIKEIREKLKTVDRSNTTPTYSEFRELKVEESFAHNGVVLHELYFCNLTDRETTPSEDLRKKIEEDFGSWDNYIADLILTAKSARGWALSGYNYIDGKITNFCLDMHNSLVPIGVRPIMVIDVYEHAYLIDYGTNRTEYLNALLKNLCWETASERYRCITDMLKQHRHT